LQTVLGHADFATTSIYLRVVATDLGVIEASVDDLYRACSDAERRKIIA